MLNEAGFATLEPDQWAARGLRGGTDGRPKTVVETLPDVYGARAFLAAHPAVDPKRIGVMGFSFGGVATMLAATRACRMANSCAKAVRRADAGLSRVLDLQSRAGLRIPRSGRGAQIHLVTGALDQYDNDPEAGPKLVAGLPAEDRGRIRTSVMAGAHHGFDMPGVDMEVQDPFGNQGKGGKLDDAP